MKALEMNSIFSSRERDRDIKMQVHRKFLDNAKPMIDSGVPESMRIGSPKRNIAGTLQQREKIAHENLKLAQQIFSIMEKPGMISDIVSNPRCSDNHPGTLNFNYRLREARRIHHDNMQLANRLDSIKPMYGKKQLSVSFTRPKNKKVTLKKVPLLKGLKEIAHEPEVSKTDRSTRKKETRRSGESATSRESNNNNRMNNILLEYTKIQDGRVIDVAVIKEPFRDRYAIFGIDIENGQRFEKRLSSEDVSNILDGDILVTSVENIEVWMALLNKINLEPVDNFTKLPSFLDSELDPEDVAQLSRGSARIPSAPLEAKSSSTFSRPGGRHGQHLTSQELQSEVLSGGHPMHHSNEAMDLEAPPVHQAATKIQASFRGMKYRKEALENGQKEEPTSLADSNDVSHFETKSNAITASKTQEQQSAVAMTTFAPHPPSSKVHEGGFSRGNKIGKAQSNSKSPVKRMANEDHDIQTPNRSNNMTLDSKHSNKNDNTSSDRNNHLKAKPNGNSRSPRQANTTTTTNTTTTPTTTTTTTNNNNHNHNHPSNNKPSPRGGHAMSSGSSSPRQKGLAKTTDNIPKFADEFVGKSVVEAMRKVLRSS